MHYQRTTYNEGQGLSFLKNQLISSKLNITLVFLLLSVVVIPMQAQNLGSIGKGSPVKVSGGINTNHVIYAASGQQSRRDPYNYFASGNLNFNIYGWSVPLSFSYSNQNTSFQQPFNQYGLSPTYKWITAHIGYRSMNFSQYTLGGHLFLGGGVDLVPNDKIKISAMYGRLQKAVQQDTLNPGVIPMYKRMGGGIKATIGSGKSTVDLIVFKATDVLNSLTLEQPGFDSSLFSPERRMSVNNFGTSQTVAPQENLSLSVGWSTTFLERLTFKGELASSAISNDITAEEVSGANFYRNLNFAFKSRSSSSYYKAMNLSMNYAFSNFGVGALYERVDPEYRTLGAYYFNNDLENISLTGNGSMLDKKLNTNVRVGLQRNNLDDTESSRMNRFSGSLGVNYQILPQWSTNFNYSNFRTVVNFRSQFVDINSPTQFDNLDTLNYRQLVSNYSLSSNYAFSQSKERLKNLSVNFSYQQSGDERGGVEQNTGSKFYNFNSGYSMNFKPSAMTLMLAANANLSTSALNKNLIFGPSLSFRKSLFDRKLSNTLTLSYNDSRTDGKSVGSVMNLRLGGNYTLKEKHRFSLTTTMVNQVNASTDVVTRRQEFIAQFGYNYNFSSR